MQRRCGTCIRFSMVTRSLHSSLCWWRTVHFYTNTQRLSTSLYLQMDSCKQTMRHSTQVKEKQKTGSTMSWWILCHFSTCYWSFIVNLRIKYVSFINKLIQPLINWIPWCLAKDVIITQMVELYTLLYSKFNFINILRCQPLFFMVGVSFKVNMNEGECRMNVAPLL